MAHKLATELLPRAKPAVEPSADRACVLGCAIDRATMTETVARADAAITRGDYVRHASINAAKLVALRRDTELREIIAACELVSADGQSVVWASRLLGDPLPERVAGIDLMQALLELAEERGHRVFILGARADALARAVRRIRDRHPRLRLAGARDGYFDEGESEAVARDVAARRPDIVFVAMPSPYKEYWIGRHGRTLGASLVMGVGGSVDVLAGDVRRAPTRLQRLGLEWLFRLAQEPRRLIGRYARTNARFVLLVAGEIARRRLSAARRPSGRTSG